MTQMALNTNVWLFASYNPFFPAKHRMLIVEVEADAKFQAKASLRLKQAERMKWDLIEEMKNI